MANSTIYYGSNGECTIEGSGIAGVQIKYVGNVKVEKNINVGYELYHDNNMILIFPLNPVIPVK